MRTILVIGIGAGDPGQLTLAATDALRQADVFFLLDKGTEKHDLLALRQDLLARFDRADHRLVEIRDPEHDRTTDGHVTAVKRLAAGTRRPVGVRHRRAPRQRRMRGVPDVGRPRARQHDRRRRGDPLPGGAIDYRVIPGVSSIATLAARHRIGLNRVGRPFLVTTARRIATGLPHDIDDIVVMLDAHCRFTRQTDQDLDIFWGAYLGRPDEILVSGPLAEVAPQIVHERQAARDRKGWIMDTYLLRRRAG
ncbi:precorrin 6A synthase [Micromonospora okii]|uniref:precorrin 6A synthase n=1 Tax=Micromonospora okii TaxID=1182970 RepID=UPI001E55FD00|nr:precorrin 6A synthase [Micromonospora okii]